MYTDLYLKFQNESEANDVLYTEVPTEFDEEGEPTAFENKANYGNIDVIGVITEGGEWDEKGKIIVEPVALEGFHVNVRVVNGEDADALQPFSVQPTQPRRLWA